MNLQFLRAAVAKARPHNTFTIHVHERNMPTPPSTPAARGGPGKGPAVARTVSMLERFRDQLKAAYVDVRAECGEAVAREWLLEAGHAIVAALGKTPKPGRKPEEDSFG